MLLFGMSPKVIYYNVCYKITTIVNILYFWGMSIFCWSDRYSVNPATNVNAYDYVLSEYSLLHFHVKHSIYSYLTNDVCDNNIQCAKNVDTSCKVLLIFMYMLHLYPYCYI